MADLQSESPNIFSVRIVSIDHYMAPPIPGYDICYSSFQGGNVNEVPVIRVYGSTPAGQKTCLHIHRALPYLYVPCADIPVPIEPNQEDDGYTHAISLALEKALKVKGNAGSKRQHVHECSLVRAKRFYGYHSSEELFVKIYLYYPNDVSRAADLLLGGAVLDRSMQPHEAHIPFILQFLVDYNLYGMGHLHVSKLKFRLPMPANFTPWKFNYNSQYEKEMDKLTGASADLQADSSGTALLNSPIWVSSTIPGDWMWRSYSEFVGPSDHNILCVKRQSLCELEGDAAVDDIVNQQFTMYTSLSQTRSDVKMVQSLIPIWQEEYERTGMHEAAMPPDPGKPLAEHVLRNISVGLEYENVLMYLCGEREQIISSFENGVKVLKSVHCAANEEKVVKLGLVNSNFKDPGRSSCLRERNIISSLPLQGLLHQEEMGSTPSKGEDACPKLISTGEMQSSEMIGTQSPKAMEAEAIELLKWLATSQAVEDLNSDDELLCETILSPLIPETTIDKVLEKANTEYERESQKECQDILDSVEDVIKIDDLEERTSSSLDPSDYCQTSSHKKIPHVDGSSDNYLLPCAGSAQKSFETVKRSEPTGSFQHQVPQDNDTSFASKPNKNKTLWGSLPIFVSQKAQDNLEAVSFNITDTGVSEMKDHRSTSSLAENELGKNSNAMNSEDADALIEKEDTAVAGGSVRDLMRRKRCYRESPDCGSLRLKRVLLTGEHKSDIPLCQNQLDFHTLQKDEHGICALEANTSTSSVQNGKKELPLSFNTKKKDAAASVGCCQNDNFDDSDLGATSAEAINCNVYSSKCGSLVDVELLKLDTEVKPQANVRLQQMDTASSSYVSLSSSPLEHKLFASDGFHDKCHEARISMERVHEICNEKLGGTDRSNDTTALQNKECVGGELRQDSTLSGFGCSRSKNINIIANPVDLIGMTFSKKPPSADCLNGAFGSDFFSSTIVDKEIYQGTSWGALDEILPFFLQDFPGERDSQSKHFNNCDSNFYQGALVGVPTHYLSDGACVYMLTPALSPPSVDAVHRWLLQEDEVTSGDINTASVEHFSQEGSHVSRLLEGAHQEAVEIPSAELNPDWNGVTTRLHSEGHVAEVNACTNCLQDVSQISGPDGRSRSTPLSQIGFRDPASVGAGEQLTLLSIEVLAGCRGDVLAGCRGDLRPDPRYDAVNVVALAFQNDNDLAVEVYVLLLCESESDQRNCDGIHECKVFVFSEEKHLFKHFIKILCPFDPDILMGWDIQGGSLGFLAERAAHLGIGLLNDISRTLLETKMAAGDLEISERGILDNMIPESVVTNSVLVRDAIIEDEWGRTHASGIHVGGRIVLNVWRLMRSEVKLNMYTVEAVAEAVLRRKLPLIPYRVLSRWFSSGPARARYRCVEYVVGRAKLNLEIMNQLDMVNRTSELARVFGIDFFSVLSRGSQFRVESMFLRLAHTQNYLAISPGNHQVASQPAMECLPLVMEPESGFYADPVVVLDFQSLYPSMIIAYNLCFCTCLGKVAPSKENILGVTSYQPNTLVLRDLKDQIMLTPNGVMYVPPKARKGILPRLLEEILSTRIMVKQAMKKLAPSQQILHRIFNSRQLALKLIANVTYGYTAAGFSGRMPCAELADSIVQCGRGTLEKAISFVNANDKWRAKVIYGDTDSMFVLLKGRTVKEAFQIGNEIASAITAMNPNPVTLKMEKVYHPCFLLTKKRYVGYSYESPDQIEPTFDAKGIETVRRDTCGAVAKMMEQSLRLFFERQEISEAKAYLQRQWTRILSGRVSLQDFIFAKEVRLGTYSTRSSSSLPPAAIVATKAMRGDPRAEPRYAERIPYVVVHGEPGARLVDMVVDPLELLAIDSPYRLNDLYYIHKQIIPALQRVFGLVGANLNNWFLEMPRPNRESFSKGPLYSSNPRRMRIDYYYLSKHCVLCGELVQASAHLCNKCSWNEAVAVTAVIGRTSKLEREMHHLAAICRHCGGGDWIVECGVKCTSLACSVFYERRKVQKELQGLSAVASAKGYYPKCFVEWF